MSKQIPTEIKLMIYKFASAETRIKLNKAFGWSFYTKNPYSNQ